MVGSERNSTSRSAASLLCTISAPCSPHPRRLNPTNYSNSDIHVHLHTIYTYSHYVHGMWWAAWSSLDQILWQLTRIHNTFSAQGISWIDRSVSQREASFQVLNDLNDPNTCTYWYYVSILLELGMITSQMILQVDVRRSPSYKF